MRKELFVQISEFPSASSRGIYFNLDANRSKGLEAEATRGPSSAFAFTIFECSHVKDENLFIKYSIDGKRHLDILVFGQFG